MQAPDPSETAPRLEAWFAKNQRDLPWRRGYDPYFVWVSEVMLQQTRVEVVVPYFGRFVERFPTIDRLANASEDEVTAAWSGLGYYRRARMLLAGARDVMARFGGRIPRTVDELLTIPGIGRYTAGAIASIAHDVAAPIVDGNVTRVVARIFASDDYWPLAERLVESAQSPRNVNQALMELGALVCKPRNPSCLICPIHDHCVARNEGRVDELPPPKEKKATRELRIPLFVIVDRQGRVLMRRESGALMTSMYHLPHGDTSLLTGTPLRVTTRDKLGVVKHTVTTRKIEFEVWTATLRNKRIESDYAWIDVTRLDAVPHPSYVRKALALVEGSKAQRLKGSKQRESSEPLSL